MQQPGESKRAIPPISEYMHRSIVSIPAEATLQDAARVMSEQSVGALLVTQGEAFVGIISEKRLAREGAAKGLNPETTRVDAVMRADPVSIDGTRTVKEAQDVMKAQAVRHLVVTESGRVVGVVSISDLIRYYTAFFEGEG